MNTQPKDSELRKLILERIASDPDTIWTPADFTHLGSRAAVDKTLQRLVASGELRRIDRGLYDRPRKSGLTGREAVPDYRAVIQAVTRRGNARFVVDGMTAANDLGLTTAVPARIEVLTDTRLKPIKLGNQEIHFKPAAVSRLFWAGRPCAWYRLSIGCRMYCQILRNGHARPMCFAGSWPIRNTVRPYAPIYATDGQRCQSGDLVKPSDRENVS